MATTTHNDDPHLEDLLPSNGIMVSPPASVLYYKDPEEGSDDEKARRFDEAEI